MHANLRLVTDTYGGRSAPPPPETDSAEADVLRTAFASAADQLQDAIALAQQQHERAQLAERQAHDHLLDVLHQRERAEAAEATAAMWKRLAERRRRDVALAALVGLAFGAVVAALAVAATVAALIGR